MAKQLAILMKERYPGDVPDAIKCTMMVYNSC